MTRTLTEKAAASLRAHVHQVARELGLWPLCSSSSARAHPVEWLKDHAADERAAGPATRQCLEEAGCFRVRALREDS